MIKNVTTNAHARERKSRIVYSEEILADILERVALGQSLNSICDEDSMPSRKTVFDWIGNNPEIKTKYEMALQMRAEKFADEIVDIADEVVLETKHEGEEVTLVLDSAAIARNKLRVDARKWVVSKLLPKKYGDKTIVSGDPENPLTTNQPVFSLTTEVLMAIARKAQIK